MSGKACPFSKLKKDFLQGRLFELDSEDLLRIHFDLSKFKNEDLLQ